MSKSSIFYWVETVSSNIVEDSEGGLRSTAPASYVTNFKHTKNPVQHMEKTFQLKSKSDSAGVVSISLILLRFSLAHMFSSISPESKPTPTNDQSLPMCYHIMQTLRTELLCVL